MACECCDNVLQHRVSYILRHEEHAPLGQSMSKATILSELDDAITEYEEERERRAEQRQRRIAG